jgi:hypothetical protein
VKIKLITNPINPIANRPIAEILETCLSSCLLGFLATFNTLEHLSINCLDFTIIDMLIKKEIDF